MNEVTLEYNEPADAGQPNTETRSNLPRFGRSWLWLFLFFIVYFILDSGGITRENRVGFGAYYCACHK